MKVTEHVEQNPRRITPTVLLTDEYGNQVTYAPPGWMWILAFALRGVPWALEMVGSGELDGILNQGAYI